MVLNEVECIIEGQLTQYNLRRERPSLARVDEEIRLACIERVLQRIPRHRSAADEPIGALSKPWPQRAISPANTALPWTTRIAAKLGHPNCRTISRTRASYAF